MSDEVVYATVRFASSGATAGKDSENGAGTAKGQADDCLRPSNPGIKAAPTPELKANSKAPPYKWLTVVLTILVLSVIMALGVCYKYYAEKRGDYEILKSKFDNLSLHMNATEHQYSDLDMKYKNISDVYNALENKVCNVCSVGWVNSNGSCYFFSTDAMNWTNSRDDCVRKGGHLVIIESKEEQTFLSNYLSSIASNCATDIQDQRYWIGLTDVVTEGVWLWMDNTPLTITYWHQRTGQPSEPDNWKGVDPSGENCVCLECTDWYDNSCTYLQKRICETRTVRT
ncbi:CD209 antigen-like protein E [Amia ocellicauda]|uniref:CD209 antigen-like protein E n=1 Tax=Amia ocellicauda TaxID=2972642 RepID=UPI0034648F2F